MSDTKPNETPQFSVQRADLVRELTQAVNCIERKTTIPILNNVRLEATGDILKITATDLEMGLITTCPARVKEEGATTLPAKRLLDYVRLLPEGSIDVSTADNHWSTIKAGKARTRIPGMPVDSYPELPAPSDPMFKIKASDFEALVSRTIYAISAQESRFTLNGALMKVQDGTVTFVATDGHRMAIVTKSCTGDRQLNVIVPRRTMTEVCKLAGISPVDVEIDVSINDNHLFFSLAGRLFVSRKVAGNFPDYERVLPKSLPNSIAFNRVEMAAVLGRVRGFSDERSRSIRLTAEPGNGVSIKASSLEVGESEEGMDAEVSVALVAGYNANYMLDVLNCFSSETVTLSYTDGHGAVKLHPTGDDSCLSILMPMRI